MLARLRLGNQAALHKRSMRCIDSRVELVPARVLKPIRRHGLSLTRDGAASEPVERRRRVVEVLTLDARRTVLEDAFGDGNKIVIACPYMVFSLPKIAGSIPAATSLGRINWFFARVLPQAAF